MDRIRVIFIDHEGIVLRAGQLGSFCHELDQLQFSGELIDGLDGIVAGKHNGRCGDSTGSGIKSRLQQHLAARHECAGVRLFFLFRHQFLEQEGAVLVDHVFLLETACGAGDFGVNAVGKFSAFRLKASLNIADTAVADTGGKVSRDRDAFASGGLHLCLLLCADRSGRDGCSVSDSHIRLIDQRLGQLGVYGQGGRSEVLFYDFRDKRNVGTAADQEDTIDHIEGDVVLVLSLPQGFVALLQSALDQGTDQILKIIAADRRGQVDFGSALVLKNTVGGLEKFLLGTECLLDDLRAEFQPGEAAAVIIVVIDVHILQIISFVRILQLLQKIAGQGIVEVIAAQIVVAGNTQNECVALVQTHDGDVESASAQVIDHKDSVIYSVFEAVVQRRRCGLLQSEFHLQPGKLAGFRRIFTGVGGEIGRNSDDGTVHYIVRILRKTVEIAFHLSFHLFEDLCGDLDGRKGQGTCAHPVIGIAHVALDRDNGFRHCAAAVKSDLTRAHALGLPVIDNDRRESLAPCLIRAADDRLIVICHHGNDTVSGSEIDSYTFADWHNSFSFVQCKISVVMNPGHRPAYFQKLRIAARTS